MTNHADARRGDTKAGANRLLALLPRPDFERLRPHLEYTALKYRQSLYRARRPPALSTSSKPALDRW